MPELPEVETMRRGLLPIVGGVIERAARLTCQKKKIQITPRIDLLSRRVVGRHVEAVDRLGKRLVLRLDSADRLVIEPRMSGIVLTGPPPSVEHLRFELSFRNRRQRVRFWDRRGLGRISLLNTNEYEELRRGGRLGCDALQVTLSEFRGRVESSRRAVKIALLDQKWIAGVGNLYASEILHLAKLDPRMPCNRLTSDEWRTLHRCLKLVLNRAIRYEGSTLSDGTYRKSLEANGRYQHYHRVYDRTGEPCLTCRRSKIVRIVQAQRSTFYCPSCQNGGRRIDA